MSPQRGRGVTSAEVYRPLLDRLWSFCDFGFVFVGGGEPFLDPDLPGFLRGIQAGAPWGDRKPHVITNGFWLLRGDWRDRASAVLPEVGTLIVSRYPAYVNRCGVAEWDGRLAALAADHPGLAITSFHSGDPTALRFTQNGFHREPKPLAQPPPCAARFCFQLLPDATVSKCPLGRALDVIPDATPEFVAEYKRSSLYPLDRGGEGFAAFVEPDAHPACALCGIGTGDLWTVPWSSDTRARTATVATKGRGG